MLKNLLSKQNFQPVIDCHTWGNWLCIAQIVEIKPVGEILHVTNVKNHYTKLIARQKHQIVNVMKLMNKCGWKRRLQVLS